MIKRTLLALLAAIWLLPIPLINRLIDWHGKAIGGAQYIDHMGVRGYITALHLLIALALATTVLLLFAARTLRVPWRLIFGASAAFLAIALLAWPPLYWDRGTFLRTLVFPYEMLGAIKAMLSIPVSTLLITFPRAFFVPEEPGDA